MPKILLAEDDNFIGRAYQDGFTRAGFEVILATDGNDAIAKTATSKPDLILLDLMMPLKDGFEVLSELKKDVKTKNIPVMIMSNLSQDSDINKCKKLGAVDYIVKSDYTMQEVIARIKKHCK